MQAITKSLWWKHPSKSKVCTAVPAYLSHSNKHRGHFGCSSSVALVTPWQPVLFGGLTEKYDMVLKLCGECSNKDGKPSWTLRWKDSLVWVCDECTRVQHIYTLKFLSNLSFPMFLPNVFYLWILYASSFLHSAFCYALEEFPPHCRLPTPPSLSESVNDTLGLG